MEEQGSRTGLSQRQEGGKEAGSAGGHCAAPWPARAVSGALSLLPIRRENVTLEQVERRGGWPVKPGSIDPGEGKVSVEWVCWVLICFVYLKDCQVMWVLGLLCALRRAALGPVGDRGREAEAGAWNLKYSPSV